MPKQVRLNLGCGSRKIRGYVNIDKEVALKPNLVLDFLKAEFPFKDNTVDEIICFHTIEHIKKSLHKTLLEECARVLKKYGLLYLSYPNFWECAQRWHSNHKGKRSFWEATIFGRQLFPADTHVCAVDPDELKEMLIELGFTNIRHFPEDPPNEFSTITTAVNAKTKFVNYSDLVASDIRSTKVRRLVS